MKLRTILNEALEANKEKHNDTYVQSEPVDFKKPPEGPDVDEEPKAEDDQQDVLDRMEDQAEIANPSSSEALRKMIDKFVDSILKISNDEQGSDRAAK
jgi:hypothetical protein